MTMNPGLIEATYPDANLADIVNNITSSLTFE